MRKNIAIVTGGNSSEYVISVKSAQLIIDNIDKGLFNPYRVEIKQQRWFVTHKDSTEIDIDKNDFSFKLNGEKIKFDSVLIMIHGSPGEDGKLQGYFEMLNIPYTSSNVLTSSVTFDKHFTKSYLKNFGISTAKWIMIRSDNGYDKDIIIKEVGFPCFVKPNNAGSSFGVTKVKNIEELDNAIKIASVEDNEILIEEFIEGKELTCGILITSKQKYAFPVTEIVSKNDFFDYEAKYTDGMSDEITPARITIELENECKVLSMKIYELLKCKWFVRIDYIYSNNILYMLEVNTIPGMSQNSIIPKMIKATNLQLKELLTEILNDIIK